MPAHNRTKVGGEARRLLAGIVAAEIDEGIERVDTADAFVGIAACNYETRNLGIYLAIESGEDIGSELY